MDKNEFIEKSKKIHGDRYDYSKVEYKNSRTKVILLCEKHGEYQILPRQHYACKQGCPYCSGYKKHVIDFIKKAKKIHGDKYDYSKVKYLNNSTKVLIICPKHGEFHQKPNNHLNGNSCPNCKHNHKKNNIEFIKKSKKIHGNKYDYSNVEYLNSKSKIKIICPKHGEFYQTPNNHYRYGCNKCGNELSSKKQLSNIDDLILNFTNIHDDKYIYKKQSYNGYDNKIKIICPKHGEFYQTPHNHSQGKGCKKCSHLTSKPEEEISGFLKNKLKIKNVIKNTKKIIKPYELDIYLPDYNLAIEYCGLYWHSNKFRDNNYHRKKYLLCKKKGIKLLTIFEDEWIYKTDIVKNIIKNSLVSKKKIESDNIIINEISHGVLKNFLNENYIGNYSDSKFCYGLKIKDELISVIFLKKDNLIEYVSKYNTDIGFDMLLNYILKKHSFSEIYINIDLRYPILNEDIFLKKQFTKNTTKDINYYYISGQKRIDKHEIKSTSNKKKHKIFDCGHIEYLFKPKVFINKQ